MLRAPEQEIEEPPSQHSGPLPRLAKCTDAMTLLRVNLSYVRFMQHMSKKGFKKWFIGLKKSQL